MCVVGLGRVSLCLLVACACVDVAVACPLHLQRKAVAEGVEDEEAALAEVDLCAPPGAEEMRLLCRMGLRWWDAYWVSKLSAWHGVRRSAQPLWAVLTANLDWSARCLSHDAPC